MNNNISKAKISLIKSLSIKKYRQEHNLFIAEGEKIVLEMLESDYNIKYIISSDLSLGEIQRAETEFIETDDIIIKKISNLKSPSSYIAIAEIPDKILNIRDLKETVTVALDEIQDPGNLGTIIRICDWFGINNIICSKNSADLYNPKVIQASMGSFLRVNVFYRELPEFIDEYIETTNQNCFGTFLEGENIYKTKLPENALYVLGNEGKGISPEVADKLNSKIFIPPFHSELAHSESLNISIATAIMCSEIRKSRIAEF